MSSNQEIEKLHKTIFSTEDLLNRDIQEKRITDDLINAFDNISKEFEDLSKKSFNLFQNSLIDQMVTFGSLNIAKDVASSIKINLEGAMARHENPISAERIKSNNYLMLFQFILSSIDSAFTNKNVDNESFITLNSSAKNLLTLSQKDKIYSEQLLKPKSQNSEQLFIEIFTSAEKSFSDI